MIPKRKVEVISPDVQKLLVACPECNGHLVHIESVSVIQKNHVTDVFQNTTISHFQSDEEFQELMKKKGKTNVRGSLIQITFWCEECRSYWIETLEFYKGNVYQYLEDDIENIANTPIDELWRD